MSETGDLHTDIAARREVEIMRLLNGSGPMYRSVIGHKLNAPATSLCSALRRLRDDGLVAVTYDRSNRPMYELLPL